MQQKANCLLWPYIMIIHKKIKKTHNACQHSGRNYCTRLLVPVYCPMYPCINANACSWMYACSLGCCFTSPHPNTQAQFCSLTSQLKNPCTQCLARGQSVTSKRFSVKVRCWQTCSIWMWGRWWSSHAHTQNCSHDTAAMLLKDWAVSVFHNIKYKTFQKLRYNQ